MPLWGHSSDWIGKIQTNKQKPRYYSSENQGVNPIQSNPLLLTEVNKHSQIKNESFRSPCPLLFLFSLILPFSTLHLAQLFLYHRLNNLKYVPLNTEQLLVITLLKTCLYLSQFPEKILISHLFFSLPSPDYWCEQNLHSNKT